MDSSQQHKVKQKQKQKQGTQRLMIHRLREILECMTAFFIFIECINRY